MKLKRNEKIVYALEASMFGALIAFLLFINSASELFKSYFIAIVMLALVIVAYRHLGFKRDNNLFRAGATRLVVASCMFFAIISYGLGIVIGFAHSYASLNIAKIFAGLVPVAILAASTEQLRYIVANSFTRDRRPYFIFCILALVTNLLVLYNAEAFSSAERAFVFTSSMILPAIALEMVCAYLCYKFGLLPAMLYRLCLSLYPYVLPFLPNLGPYIHSVILLIMAFTTYMLCSKIQIYYDRDRSRFRRYSLSILTIPLLIITIAMTVLVSGIARYQIIAIGSDSMRPIYARGDAVIFEKVSTKEIREGDILVFKRGNKIITHRIIKIEQENGRRRYITKGDANDERDEGSVGESEALGCVRLFTKFIGFPTLWINSLFEQEK